MGDFSDEDFGVDVYDIHFGVDFGCGIRIRRVEVLAVPRLSLAIAAEAIECGPQPIFDIQGWAAGNSGYEGSLLSIGYPALEA